MLAIYVFQVLLNSIGWLLAKIFDLVGSYGLSIIILTVLIKVVLLPLGIKQIKSMQAMQAIQPKVKDLQKKYKGNKQRIQEETMKLYKEAGVNPLGGCLPTLLQLPILVAMYAVIRAPLLAPITVSGKVDHYEIHNNHLPVDSKLFKNVVLHENLSVIGLDLQCSAAQSGSQAQIGGTDRNPVAPDKPIVSSAGQQEIPFNATTGTGTLPCGSNTTDKIPYFLLLAVMIGTMFYQQRQMQRASPPGAASQQQQTLLYLMPIMFGVIGFAFPAGLTLYWTISNVWTIGQQFVLLKAGHIGPEAMERRIAEQAKKNENKPAKSGFRARMQERAAEARKTQPPRKPGKPQPGRSGSGRSGQSGAGGRKPAGTGNGSGSTGKQGPQPRQRRPNTGNPKPSGGSGQRPKPRKPGSGGSGGTGDGETRE
jgi:YidC/Oxa1 family membrane protein insertase